MWDGSSTPEESPRAPVTVFLLDDHELLRHGIRSLLERQGDIVVVGESSSAAEAARRIPALRPDVAILDVRLPDGSGVDVCRQVRSIDPTIAVLMLTSYDEDEALFAAIMAGAAGYVLKEVKAADFVDSVRRVAGGHSMLDPVATSHVLERLRHGPPKDPLTKHLTPKEHQVLELVGQGLTNRQIAEHLGLAEKTTKNYVSIMLGKLGVETRTQAAIIATRQDHHPSR
ncbi:response regulator [Nocardioides campestrisoli]|uniref:response regulator n=1 Tax=Nocardioides campestrisoli TaxID=2736757 RepID=UPI0015E73D14|nr:response regulator transcription factor [Nocardioides campestrisoli]